MRTVQASAKTREEAIQKALDSLGVEMYEIDDITIVDEGSKGLFGFGARPVVVQVTIENHPDEHALPDKPRRERERPERNRKDGGDRPRRDANAPKTVDKQAARPEKADRGAEKSERSGRPEKRAQQDKEPQEGRGRRGGRGRGRGGNAEARDKDTVENKAEGKPEKRSGTRSERKRGGGQQPQQGDAAKDNRQERNKRGGNRKDRDQNRNQDKDQARAPKNDAPRQQDAPQAPPEPEPLPPNAVEEDLTVNISDDQGAQAAALLQDIIEKMGITAQVSFSRADDGSARLNVASEDGAILIGRKGRTLNALQYLINRMISLQEDSAENTERVLVDVEGYIDRRRKTLEDMARNFAKKAKETRRNMRLKPLSPQERRIVHLTLQDDDEVRTFSLGDSLYRSIVISPRNAQRGNGGGRGRNSNNNNNDAAQDSPQSENEGAETADTRQQEES